MVKFLARPGNRPVRRVLVFLSKGSVDWKDRFKENSDKMRMGSLLGIAEVAKDAADFADQ
jgi:RNA polymerase-interacting CarD/CdnL/TRCF family regulator